VGLAEALPARDRCGSERITTTTPTKKMITSFRESMGLSPQQDIGPPQAAAVHT
jgi:hypothetical protein